MIREMRLVDLPQILPIEKASFSDPWTESTFVSAFELSPFFFGFVHEEEGEILGYICGDAVLEDGQLMSVATSPCHRKKGVAKGLIERFDRECVYRGATACFLEVRVGNLPALTLYESTGYERIGIRKKYYPDGEDAFAMKKTLSKE